MACVAVLAGSSGAAKISPTLNMDTCIDAGNKNESFGTDDTLRVASENGQTIRITYLTFAGTTALPQQINSGSLKMYAKEVERPGKVSNHLYNKAAMDIVTRADQPEYNLQRL